MTSPTSPSMTAGRGQSDNSSATSRRNSGCLTALFLFLIKFLKLQESHFSRRLSNKTMTSDRYMSWTLCGDSKLTQQMPLPLTPITTSFGMQPISMISIKSRKDLRERHSSLNKKKSVMMMNMPMQKSNFPLIQNQRNILHIQFISHHFTPRCHKSLSSLPTSGKHFLSITRKSSSITLHHTLVGARLNLTLVRLEPTPAAQQVHQHSQDEPTEEPTPDTSTQTLVNKCLAESGIDPTDIQNVMPVSYAKRNISSHESSRQIQTHQVFARVNQSKHHNCDDLDPTDTPSAVPTALQAPSDDTYNPKCTHSLMETQCNHSQYPILMKKNCTHNPSTSQVSKSYHPNPVTFPYPPDPGEHVLEMSSAPTTLVERAKLDLSSLIPPKGEMESSFSWTCPFKSPTSSTLCFGEPTLGKLNQETDFYMTKHMPKPSSGANRVSASHSSLVTKNGSISIGRTSYMIFPSHGSTSRRLTGETNSSSTTLHMDTCSWKLTGEANSTTPHVDILWLTGKVMKHTLLDTRPKKLIGVVMTLTLTM